MMTTTTQRQATPCSSERRTTQRALAPSTALAALLLAATLLAGCSFSTLTTASNLPEGEGQFFVAPGFTRFQRGSGEALLTPQVELGGRYAITDRVEVGGKIWLPGVQIDTKIGLLGVHKDGSGFNLALDPAIGYLGGFEGTPDGGDTLHIITMSLPVLIGWEFGDHELTLGPRIIDQVWTGGGESTMTANVVSLGMSMGFSIYVGRGVTIVPEFSYGAIVMQSLEDFGSHVGVNGTMMQAGVGFVFGTHGQTEMCPCEPTE